MGVRPRVVMVTKREAYVVCPECGTRMWIDAQQIAGWKSVVCGRTSCSYYEMHNLTADVAAMRHGLSQECTQS